MSKINCGISFVATSIKKKDLHYEKNTDKIVFEDCEENSRGEKPAQYGMVFMAKGICKKWKHALGYFLFNRSLSPNTIKNMIQDCAKELTACGFHPKFVVCDHDSSNKFFL